MNFIRSPQINLDSGNCFELRFERRHLQEARMWSRIDQQIEVAAIFIVTTRHRPEDTWIRHPGLQNQAANRIPLLFQYL